MICAPALGLACMESWPPWRLFKSWLPLLVGIIQLLKTSELEKLIGGCSSNILQKRWQPIVHPAPSKLIPDPRPQNEAPCLRTAQCTGIHAVKMTSMPVLEPFPFKYLHLL